MRGSAFQLPSQEARCAGSSVFPRPAPRSPGDQVWLGGQDWFRSWALAGAQRHHPDTCLPAVGPAPPGPDSPRRRAGVCGAGAGMWGQGPILFLLRLDLGPCNVDFVDLCFAYLYFHFCSNPAYLLFQFCSDACCLVAQSCPTPCDPIDSSLLGSSVHGISQARILEWLAISYSRGSSQTRG